MWHIHRYKQDISLNFMLDSAVAHYQEHCKCGKPKRPGIAISRTVPGLGLKAPRVGSLKELTNEHLASRKLANKATPTRDKE